MSDEFATLKRSLNQLADGCQFVECGVVGLYRLLDGRCYHAQRSVVLKGATLAVVTLDRDKAAHPHLGGLFQEPLVAVDIFSWSHGHRE